MGTQAPIPSDLSCGILSGTSTALTEIRQHYRSSGSRGAAVSSIVGAAFGAAGQRCMALSVAVLVGDAGRWAEDIAEKASGLKVIMWGVVACLSGGDGARGAA